MNKGIWVIGTDTEVGKTVIAAGLMHLLLKNGYRASYFKPVASGEVIEDGISVPADAAFVRAVSGFDEDLQKVTPFFYTDSVAPHLAARLTARKIDVTIVRESLHDLKSRYDLIVAEAAGGLMVPMSDDGPMQYELIREMGFPCLLVARAGLGTINHTLLTLRVAREEGLKVRGIIINQAGFDMIEKDNIEMIKKHSGVTPVLVLPVIKDLQTDKLLQGKIRKVFEDHINIHDMIAIMDEI